MLADILTAIAETDKKDEQHVISLIQQFNRDYSSCDCQSTELLKSVLEFSETEYYNQTEENPDRILADPVYDYIKEVYESRMADIYGVAPDDSQMSHVPDTVARMVKLPIWMGSCKKMNHGQGQVKVFNRKYPGPYNISAKMDGCSCLYLLEHGVPRLYSRGKRDEGQNISELLKYMPFPAITPDVMIRGELIMRQSVFRAKYQRQSSEDTDKFSNSRNAIAGMVNKMGSNAFKSVDTPLPGLRAQFVRDMEFVAYEYITPVPIHCSAQFEKLDHLFDDRVAKHQVIADINDEILSSLYDHYIETMDYEIDGLVVCSNAIHERPYGENPDYLRAFKKPLAILTARTTVTEVTWDVSREGYLRPVVHFEPVSLNDVIISKASGHNAKMIQDSGLGAGSVIDIIRSGGVIPKIINVVEPAKPGFPDCEFKWNDSKVHIYPVTREARPIDIKQLHHFLTKMGTKGIGKKLMERLYDGGINSIPLLLTVTEADLSFIGGKTAVNIVNTIQQNKANLTLPVLAGSCGIFGSLMGVTRFEMIFGTYPDILSSPEVVSNDVPAIVEKLKTVPGFADKTARQAAAGFAEFLQFLADLRAAGISPVSTVTAGTATVNTDVSASGASQLKGRNILMTGFRDMDIATFIIQNGGKNLKSLTRAADMLLIKDASTKNMKTEDANNRGIEILTKDQFVQRYM